jgi:uncharacterized membrane protein
MFVSVHMRRRPSAGNQHPGADVAAGVGPTVTFSCWFAITVTILSTSRSVLDMMYNIKNHNTISCLTYLSLLSFYKLLIVLRS